MKESDEMRKRSGEIDSRESLVAFLYHLCRDHLAAGVVEEIVRKSIVPPEETNQFSNGWLASYAKDISQRLLT